MELKNRKAVIGKLFDGEKARAAIVCTAHDTFIGPVYPGKDAEIKKSIASHVRGGGYRLVTVFFDKPESVCEEGITSILRMTQRDN